MKDIGKNIKYIRQQKGMTQDDLAEALFVSRQTISNYENGRSRPDVDMIIKMAEIFETDANAVLYGPPVPEDKKQEYKKLYVGVSILLIAGFLYCLGLSLDVLTGNGPWQTTYFAPYSRYIVKLLFHPVLFFFVGWCLLQLISIPSRLKPLHSKWSRLLRAMVLSLTIFLAIIPIPYVIFMSVADYRTFVYSSVSMHFPHIPVYSEIATHVMKMIVANPAAYTLIGGAYWFVQKTPKSKKEEIRQ